MITIQPHFAPAVSVPVGSVVQTKDGLRVHILDAPSNSNIPVRKLHDSSECGVLHVETPVRYISSIIDYESLCERA